MHSLLFNFTLFPQNMVGLYRVIIVFAKCITILLAWALNNLHHKRGSISKHSYLVNILYCCNIEKTNALCGVEITIVFKGQLTF